MSARWLPGIWLRKRWASEEHVVCMEDGKVVRSNAVREHPDGLWNVGLFNCIKGSPWDPQATGIEQGDLDKERPAAGEPPKAPVITEATPTSRPPVRRAKIMKYILDDVNVGYTDGFFLMFLCQAWR